MIPFGGIEGMAAPDAMPFLQTGAAAGAGRMLGDEDWMPAEWRLLAVIGREGGCEPLFDQLPAVSQDGGETFPVQVFTLRSAQMEPSAKSRSGQSLKDLIVISHLVGSYHRERPECGKPTDLHELSCNHFEMSQVWAK
jgi:hypothetical protein